MRQRLTENEKKVIFALAERSDRTDLEIAKRVSVHESTASQIRRNLMGKGIIEFLNIPAFHKLGYELMADVNGVFDPAVYPNLPDEEFFLFIRDHPEILDGVKGAGSFGLTGAFVSVTDFFRFLSEMKSFLIVHGIPAKKVGYSLWPFDLTRISYHYNYAPCLNRIFRLGMDDAKSNPPEKLRRGRVELTKKEARMLVELIASPEKSDSQIARQVGRSRQSVTEMKHRFLSEGLYERIAIPTFRSKIFERTVFVSLLFDSEMSYSGKVALAGNNWWEQSIFVLETPSALSALYLFGGEEDSNALLKEYIGSFMNSRILSREPTIFSLPIGPSTELPQNTYHLAVEKILQA